MSEVEGHAPHEGALSRSVAWVRVAVAGLLLALVDVGVTFGRAYCEFLSLAERWEFAVAAGAVGLASVAAVRTIGAGYARLSARFVPTEDARRRLGALVAGGVAFAAGAGLAWSLTGGRRVRDLAARPVVVAIAALALALVVALVVRRRPRAASLRFALACLGVTTLAALADSFVLPRLYAAFHLGLAGLGVVSASLAVDGIDLEARFRRRPLVAYGLSVVLALGCVGAPFLVTRLSRSPNAGFVAARRSFEAGKWIALAARAFARDASPEATAAQRTSVHVATESTGIDLRDRDFLLVTVDALRADRLRAFGGHGLTPSMDALAAEGAVFAHAYTPTPHTSYALASLLTGKFLRPVLELPDAPTEHATLPDLLRRYGYRTAAFYPPAIFFVDAHRFGTLARDGFGFEYRKEMYAPAEDRVTQVSAYLDDAPADRPVFVWVHLFEPHEPYEPSERFRRGETAEQRYDGEVAAADAALGDLVRAFRARRPNATVVLAADHGEEFGDHGGYYHGSSLYEEQVKVPLVWSSPGVVPPHVVEAPVELVDLAPTVLGAVGIPADARMRGEDLGPILATASPGSSQPQYAFADLADARMVTDGTWKVICGSASTSCSVFDLAHDPRERRNVAEQRPDVHDRFRSALYAFVASVPEVEAMAFAGASAWPPALARAELGDASVGPEVVPLLGDARAEVRAASARALVKLRYAPAVRVLARLSANDPDPNVRAEADIARLALGDVAAASAVEGALALGGDDEASRALRRRAAFALGDAGHASAVRELAALALSTSESEDVRTRAIEVLGALRAPEAVPALVEVLSDVRLRSLSARALGLIGDRRAARPLARALATERYTPAREAEATALAALGDRGVVGSVRRFLGMETGLPGGVGLLLELGAVRGRRADSADLRNAPPAPPFTTDSFTCDARGCSVRGETTLPVSTPRRGHFRLVVRVDASDGSVVTLGGHSSRPLDAGMRELSFACDEIGCDRPTIAVRGDARLVAYVVVPVSPEIPAPPPEPWDGGVPDASNAPAP